MEKSKKSIAIITARGGSKRIKNKNIINFYGKPIISYSILAAKKSKLFDKIYICTDSKKIKKVSTRYGAKFISYRLKKLSDDHTGTYDVIKNFIKKNKIRSKYICCIYPTAPLMQPTDLKKGLNLLKKNQDQYIYSANTYKKKYVDSGQFYWGTLHTWKKKKNILNKNSIKLKILNKYAHDLNTYDDLKILKSKKKKILSKN